MRKPITKALLATCVAVSLGTLLAGCGSKDDTKAAGGDYYTGPMQGKNAQSKSSTVNDK